jgi:hypothetical protein
VKTEHLIEAIVTDAEQRPPLAGGRHLAGAMALGVAVSVVVFFMAIGLRPDLVDALTNWRFLVKVALVVIVFAVAVADVRRLSRPTETAAVGRGTWFLLVAVATAVVIELASTPPETWLARLAGSNAVVCLAVVPLLAAAPLATVLWTGREGAPASPAAAGAAIGRLAGAVGALLYAMHCIDDSPLFVAVWYGLAILALTWLGAVLGRQVLRW